MELSEPIACTLTSAGLATQGERWRTLTENFGLDRVETAEGLLLRFACHAAVEAELRALVAIESECCSWASWDIQRDEDALVVVVRSSGEGAATLHSMFTRLG
ncbi:MAG TPA: hypothetical protein VFQ44_00800 [Streptosporangiaceae bacterium]|nr:hypothetical protein [Streptosporangiaceae bacterium]